MKTNKPGPVQKPLTYEGAPADHITHEQALKRSVMTCFLFEKNAYEDGQSVAQRIKSLVPLCTGAAVAAMAVEARTKMHLRHVPLLLVREMARYPHQRGLVAATLDQVILRADELAEFVALYWEDKKEPLSNQVKKGLAKAFTKFSEHELAKYGGNK